MSLMGHSAAQTPVKPSAGAAEAQGESASLLQEKSRDAQSGGLTMTRFMDPRTSKPFENLPRSAGWLLREFDRTAPLLDGFLTTHYGEQQARSLVREARERLDKILPRVPWLEGRQAPVLNRFLGITALELSVYQAIEARGGDAQEAWEVCHRALRLRLARTPRWKRWLMNRLLFSRLVRRIISRRAEQQEVIRSGDFETRSVVGNGAEFDIGTDYLGCGNLELARKVGAEDFAPYICMSDIALSDTFDWGLIRTQTLADGCSHCDFRFKKGELTRITSRTPAVQEAIDRIAAAESHATLAPTSTDD